MNQKPLNTIVPDIYKILGDLSNGKPLPITEEALDLLERAIELEETY